MSSPPSSRILPWPPRRPARPGCADLARRLPRPRVVRRPHAGGSSIPEGDDDERHPAIRRPRRRPTDPLPDGADRRGGEPSRSSSPPTAGMSSASTGRADGAARTPKRASPPGIDHDRAQPDDRAEPPLTEAAASYYRAVFRWPTAVVRGPPARPSWPRPSPRSSPSRTGRTSCGANPRRLKWFTMAKGPRDPRRRSPPRSWAT